MQRACPQGVSARMLAPAKHSHGLVVKSQLTTQAFFCNISSLHLGYDISVGLSSDIRISHRITGILRNATGSESENLFLTRNVSCASRAQATFWKSL